MTEHTGRETPRRAMELIKQRLREAEQIAKGERGGLPTSAAEAHPQCFGSTFDEFELYSLDRQIEPLDRAVKA